MNTTYRTGAKSIAEIEPLVKSNGERIENGWQSQRSLAIITACRPVRVGDWLPKGAYFGTLLGALPIALVTLFVAMGIPHGYGPQPPENLILAGALVIAASTAAVSLLFRRGCLRDRRIALSKHAPDELDWHRRLEETRTLAYRFDNRLKALKDYEANAETGATVDPTTVMHCALERAELDGRLRALAREDAVRRLKASGHHDTTELVTPSDKGLRTVDVEDDGTDFTVAHYQNRWRG